MLALELPAFSGVIPSRLSICRCVDIVRMPLAIRDFERLVTVASENLHQLLAHPPTFESNQRITTKTKKVEKRVFWSVA